MQDKSDQNWSIGLKCWDEKSLNVAASRLYYGIFQAVLGYARRKKGYAPDRFEQRSTHVDMINIVNEDFAQDRRARRAYKEFRTLRETADYSPDTPRHDEIAEIMCEGQLVREHYLKEARK